MKNTYEDYEAFAVLNVNNPRFVEWLKRRLKATETTIRTGRDEVDVRWAQGRAQEIADMIEAIEGAAEILRKADERASRRE